MKITLLIFSLNEIEGFKVVGPRIKKEWVDEVMVVDGGSTDGTVEYAKSLGFKVYVQKGRGMVEALREGFKEAIGEGVIMFSPDNNMIPEKIPEIVDKMRQGNDLVICSRYLQGAKSDDDNVVTGFGNWMFTTMVNVLFGAKYTDVLGLYRGFRKAMVEELNIDIKTSINTQLCIRAAKKGFPVAEVPGDEPPRVGGFAHRRILYHGSIELMTILGEFFFPFDRKRILAKQ